MRVTRKSAQPNRPSQPRIMIMIGPQDRQAPSPRSSSRSARLLSKVASMSAPASALRLGDKNLLTHPQLVPVHRRVGILDALGRHLDLLLVVELDNAAQGIAFLHDVFE